MKGDSTMRKKFKMVLISLSFLIIGGLLVACGKVKEEKVTTEVTESTEETNLVDGYVLNLPNGYELGSEEDGVYTYNNGKSMITYYVTEPEVIAEDVTYDHLHAMLAQNFGGVEIDYYTEDIGDVKYANYIARQTIDNIIYTMDCNLFADVNKKKYVTLVQLANGSDENFKQEASEFFDYKEQFIEENFK